VQDAGAQLAARLLAAGPGHRVLDACAAPGGKTAHILQRPAPPTDLLAIDIEPQRLALVAGTLQRIGVAARLRAVDLAAFGVLDAEAPFDRILLDAPCSATGVIRRHPDIKLLRRPEDIQAFARLQGLLLDRCFAKLAPAGRLVYATCSVLPQENEAVVQAFLDRTPAARSSGWPEGVELPPGSVQGACGVQLLPGAGAGTDGFYYACLGRGESE
jgi:16S rRNA (cytosine967-C5)-methyltransferase